MKIISLDMETHKLSIETGPTPKPVCLARAVRDECGQRLEDTRLLIGEDMRVQWAEDMAAAARGEAYLVGQNFAYDIGVALAHFEESIEDTFKALDAGQIYDTMLAEKIMNLARFGIIRQGFCKGVNMTFGYGLDELAKLYGVLPEGYEQLKHGADGWRLRYGELEGIPLRLWPKEAIEYPLLDAEVTLDVAMRQIDRGEDLSVLPFRVRTAIAARVFGMFGLRVDLEAREKAREAAEKINAENEAPLIDAGIITPAVPAMPYKRGGIGPDGLPKMKKAQKAKTSKKDLQLHVLDIIREGVVGGLGDDIDDELEQLGIDLEEIEAEKGDYINERKTRWLSIDDIVLTDASEKDDEFMELWNAEGPMAALTKFPGYVGTSKKFLAACASAGPILPTGKTLLEHYRDRQSVQKIITTELPRISPDKQDPSNLKKGEALYTDEQKAAWLECPIVWPEYDSLKETGRLSSYASKLFPSLNAQNIAGVMRGAYRSHSDERLLVSQDFGGMELVSSAQVFLELFGKSTMADILNAGEDIHGYTGAQFAYDQSDLFRAHCANVEKHPFEIYKAFKEWKRAPEGSDELKCYKHFRKMAKPFNLGLIGGLAQGTFRVVAAAQYEVVMDEAEAKRYIEQWHALFPEVRQYLQWIKNHCRDIENEERREVRTKKLNKETGLFESKTEIRTFTKFVYTTPSGLRRANCGYCAAANGKAMQGTSSDGANAAAYEVAKRIMLDQFFGAVPYALIHDEIIVDCEEDKVDDVAALLSEIMVSEFRKITPDVKIRTEFGIMRHWTKAAGPDAYPDGTCMTYEERQLGLTENPRLKKIVEKVTVDR